MNVFAINQTLVRAIGLVTERELEQTADLFSEGYGVSVVSEEGKRDWTKKVLDDALQHARKEGWNIKPAGKKLNKTQAQVLLELKKMAQKIPGLQDMGGIRSELWSKLLVYGNPYKRFNKVTEKKALIALGLGGYYKVYWVPGPNPNPETATYYGSGSEHYLLKLR